jgi:hypothetical protein
LQGYVIKLGRVPNNPAGIAARVLLLIAALYLTIPVERFVGLPMAQAIVAGLALASAGLGLLYFTNKKSGRIPV